MGDAGGGGDSSIRAAFGFFILQKQLESNRKRALRRLFRRWYLVADRYDGPSSERDISALAEAAAAHTAGGAGGPWGSLGGSVAGARVAPARAHSSSSNQASRTHGGPAAIVVTSSSSSGSGNGSGGVVIDGSGRGGSGGAGGGLHSVGETSSRPVARPRGASESASASDACSASSLTVPSSASSSSGGVAADGAGGPSQHGGPMLHGAAVVRRCSVYSTVVPSFSQYHHPLPHHTSHHSHQQQQQQSQQQQQLHSQAAASSSSTSSPTSSPPLQHRLSPAPSASAAGDVSGGAGGGNDPGVGVTTGGVAPDVELPPTGQHTRMAGAVESNNIFFRSIRKKKRLVFFYVCLFGCLFCFSHLEKRDLAVNNNNTQQHAKPFKSFFQTFQFFFQPARPQELRGPRSAAVASFYPPPLQPPLRAGAPSPQPRIPPPR